MRFVHLYFLFVHPIYTDYLYFCHRNFVMCMALPCTTNFHPQPLKRVNGRKQQQTIEN